MKFGSERLILSKLYRLDKRMMMPTIALSQLMPLGLTPVSAMRATRDERGWVVGRYSTTGRLQSDLHFVPGYNEGFRRKRFKIDEPLGPHAVVPVSLMLKEDSLRISAMAAEAGARILFAATHLEDNQVGQARRLTTPTELIHLVLLFAEEDDAAMIRGAAACA